MKLEYSDEEIERTLRKYILPKYANLNNWKIIIERAEEIEEGIFAFKCNINQTIYVDQYLQPVSYGKQHIIDDNYYYDFNTTEGSGTYTLIGGKE